MADPEITPGEVEAVHGAARHYRAIASKRAERMPSSAAALIKIAEMLERLRDKLVPLLFPHEQAAYIDSAPINRGGSMVKGDVQEFDHRGRHVRLERRGTDWAVILDATIIDRIPANVDESPNADLEALARQVVNSHLDGLSPHGF